MSRARQHGPHMTRLAKGGSYHVASFVYLTANRDEFVPRQPLRITRPKRPSPF